MCDDLSSADSNLPVSIRRIMRPTNHEDSAITSLPSVIAAVESEMLLADFERSVHLQHTSEDDAPQKDNGSLAAHSYPHCLSRVPHPRQASAAAQLVEAWKQGQIPVEVDWPLLGAGEGEQEAFQLEAVPNDGLWIRRGNWDRCPALIWQYHRVRWKQPSLSCTWSVAWILRNRSFLRVVIFWQLNCFLRISQYRGQKGSLKYSESGIVSYWSTIVVFGSPQEGRATIVLYSPNPDLKAAFHRS